MEIIKARKTLIVTSLKESDLREREERIRPLLNILGNNCDMVGSEKMAVLLMLMFAECANIDKFEDFVIDDDSLSEFIKWLAKSDLLKLATDVKGYLTRLLIYNIHAGFMIQKYDGAVWKNDSCGKSGGAKKWFQIRKGFVSGSTYVIDGLKKKAKEICEKYNLAI